MLELYESKEDKFMWKIFFGKCANKCLIEKGFIYKFTITRTLFRWSIQNYN